MTQMRNVLCPVDFSPLSERVVRLAAGICKAFGSRLVIYHSVPAPPPSVGAGWMYAGEHEGKGVDAEPERHLQELFARLPAGIQAEGTIAYGPFDRLCLRFAAELPADVLVMGTHDPRNTERPSAAERIILEAPCPVLVIRDDGTKELASVLEGENRVATVVPVDFTPHSLRALDYAVELARRLPIDLHVLHVDPAGENASEARHAVEAQIPRDVRAHSEVTVRRGAPFEVILGRDHELGARLKVVGTHRKGVIRSLFGRSTSRRLLHESPCPVWFVPETAVPAVAR
jgi:nucleotide-binding universal stress UspA family protein